MKLHLCIQQDQWTPALERCRKEEGDHDVRCWIRERSGSMVECLTQDREVADSSLTGVTAL